MYAVNGIYSGGDTVKIETRPVSLGAPYRVIVTFIEPADASGTAAGSANNAGPAKKRAAFARLTEYHKSLPANFDYEKELAEYRDEKFDRTD
jgi:hypothetical protein